MEGHRAGEPHLVDRRVSKPPPGLAGRLVEERASLLLMQAAGMPHVAMDPNFVDHAGLATRFVGPMQSSLVGNMRTTLGEMLGPFVVDAEA
jgi:hypothetical protein